MILADSGIPRAAIANDPVGHGSQTGFLLATFEYTKLLPLILVPSKRLPYSRSTRVPKMWLKGHEHRVEWTKLIISTRP